MCLVAFAFQALPDGGTLIAANRDEFHARAALALSVWPDSPDIIAGRDVSAGGTWMGSTFKGRFGFVTNYRDPALHRTVARSRGDLVVDFLESEVDAATYMDALRTRADQYNGFNLIVGDAIHAAYYSNMGGPPQTLSPGLYLLSNHLLDSPWPKALRLRARLNTMMQAWRDGQAIDPGALTAMMKDETPAADEDLPNTGVSLARERMLSSPFIISPDYGTRSTAIMYSPKTGAGWIAETRYRPDARVAGATLITTQASP